MGNPNTAALSASIRKYIFWSIVFAVACFAVFEFASRHWTLAYTREGHSCLPYRFWIIEKGVTPGRDEYVAFRGHEIPNFANGVRWVKILSGMPGDILETLEIPQGDRDRYRKTVDLNGMPVPLRIQGYVHLHTLAEPWFGKEYKVFETDTKGRRVPMVSSQVIPPRKYFVSAPAPRSFDSRYWGLIDEEDIIGRAHPIF